LKVLCSEYKLGNSLYYIALLFPYFSYISNGSAIMTLKRQKMYAIMAQRWQFTSQGVILAGVFQMNRF